MMIKRIAIVLLLLVMLCLGAVPAFAQTLTLPENLSVIEAEAFYGTTGIETVILPEGVTEIGSKAFAQSSLSAINLPQTLTSIADDAFEGCGEIAVTAQEGSYAYTWAMEQGLIEERTPSEPTEEEERTPSEPTEEEERTPSEPTEEEERTPSEPTEEEERTPSEPTEEEERTPSEPEEEERTPSEATPASDFTYTIENVSVSITGYSGSDADVIIPEEIEGYPVTAVADSAFSGCTTMISVTIPDSVTSIGDTAFEKCTALTSVKLPVGLKHLGEFAFSNCSSLTRIELPESLSEVGSGAFVFCSNLSEVVIPEGVKVLHFAAFNSCSNLKSVTLPASICTIGQGCFYNYSPTFRVIENSYAHKWCVQNSHAYELIESENELPSGFGYEIRNGQAYILGYYGTETNLTVPSEIEGYPVVSVSMLSNTVIQHVVLPDTVTQIGDSAFRWCSNLVSINIPQGVVSIGKMAFEQCMSLAEMQIPEGVVSLGTQAFMLCPAMTTIELPASLTSIGEYCFLDCYNLTAKVISGSYAHTYCEENEIAYELIGGVAATPASDFTYTIENDSVSITAYNGSDATVVVPSEIEGYPVTSVSMRWNTVIEQVTLPDSVTEIGANAFQNCENLSRVNLLDCVTVIGDWAFASCSALESVGIPQSVTAIGSYAFYMCTKLASIDLPQNLEIIERDAFRQTNLSEVVVPDGVTAIRGGAFADCGELQQVTIPASIYAIGENSFPDSVTICVVENSYAHRWCVANGYTYALSETSAELPSGYAYSIQDDQAYISGYYGTETNLTIPSEIEGCPVVSVSLRDNGFVETVILPDTVKHINAYAFEYCRKLTSINIPEGITEIGSQAFDSCSALEEITIPGSVTTLKSYAFYGCTSLTGLTLSEGLKSTAFSAFEGCTALKEVVIPESMTTIGVGTFFECTSLAKVTIPVSVNEIGVHCFDGCSDDLTIYVIEGSYAHTYCEENEIAYELIGGVAATPASDFTYTIENDSVSITAYNGTNTAVVVPSEIEGYPVAAIAQYAFSWTVAESVWIPDSVTVIEDRAFYGCYDLLSVRLPSGITAIGTEMFANCGALTSVQIPASVTSIAPTAFRWCGSLTSFTVESGNTAYAAADGVLYNADMTNLVMYPLGRPDTVFSIPEGVTAIADSAFGSVGALTEIEIPVSLTSIPDGAFSGLSLSSIAVAEGNVAYKTVDGVLFTADGTKLLIYPSGKTDTAYSIPEGTTEIAAGAFMANQYITAIAIPSTLTSFTPDDLSYFENLAGVSVAEGNSAYSAENGVLFNAAKTVVLYYPDSKVGSAYIIPEGVTEIGEMAFHGAQNLTSITLPESLTRIGMYGLAYCGITSLDLPENLTSIGMCAFEGSKLTSSVLPDSVTAVEDYAFGYCEDLQSVTLSAGMTRIGAVFYGNTKLYEIVISEGITEIGDYAFSHCSALTELVIPEGVTIIGNAFSGCTNLTSITIPASVGSIYYNNADDHAFADCPNLTVYVIEGSYAHTFCEENGINYELQE